MESELQPIFTIGHGSHPLWLFISKLAQYRVDLVIDCRTFPQSRFCPHFNRIALKEALEAHHIKYLWKGGNLGGRGINLDEEKTIDQLCLMAEYGLRLCLLCSEAAESERCHLTTKLTPDLERRGVFVERIEYDIRLRRSKPKTLFN